MAGFFKAIYIDDIWPEYLKIGNASLDDFNPSPKDVFGYQLFQANPSMPELDEGQICWTSLYNM